MSTIFRVVIVLLILTPVSGRGKGIKKYPLSKDSSKPGTGKVHGGVSEAKERFSGEERAAISNGGLNKKKMVVRTAESSSSQVTSQFVTQLGSSETKKQLVRSTDSGHFGILAVSGERKAAKGPVTRSADIGEAKPSVSGGKKKNTIGKGKGTSGKRGWKHDGKRGGGKGGKQGGKQGGGKDGGKGGKKDGKQGGGKGGKSSSRSSNV